MCAQTPAGVPPSESPSTPDLPAEAAAPDLGWAVKKHHLPSSPAVIKTDTFLWHRTAVKLFFFGGVAMATYQIILQMTPAVDL